jgi:hypothetical protein
MEAGEGLEKRFSVDHDESPTRQSAVEPEKIV